MMRYFGGIFSLFVLVFLLLGLYGQQNMCLHVTCLMSEEKATGFNHQTIVNGTIELLPSTIYKNDDFL